MSNVSQIYVLNKALAELKAAQETIASGLNYESETMRCIADAEEAGCDIPEAIHELGGVENDINTAIKRIERAIDIANGKKVGDIIL